ncbi:MAG: hypothetical protein ABI164_05725, partial [Acidobacteriaceae bacterium]
MKASHFHRLRGFMQSISPPSSPGRIAPIHTLHLRRVASCMVAGIFLFTSIIGCQTHKIRSQAQGGSGVALGHGLTTATLTDASFGGMPATQVAVPTGWKTQGQATTGHCPNLPFSSWNAVSPDGQSQFDVLPPFGWQWSQRTRGGNGCIPLAGKLTAADFLQKFAARVPGLQVLGPMPVDETFRSHGENYTNIVNSNNARMAPMFRTRSTADVAAFRAFDAKGHETRLRVWVECAEGSFGGSCFAKVDILSAPKGRLNALVALVDGHDLVMGQPIPQYRAAIMNRQQQQGKQQLDAESQRDAATSKMLHDQYVSSSERLRAAHQAGMEELQRSTDSSMRNANNDMHARTTAASDWRDYAADQQTVS